MFFYMSLAVVCLNGQILIYFLIYFLTAENNHLILREAEPRVFRADIFR